MFRLIWTGPKSGTIQYSPYVFTHKNAIKRAKSMNKFCRANILEISETEDFIEEEIHPGKKWQSLEQCLSRLDLIKRKRRKYEKKTKTNH